ncbi:MAG: pyruvate kinase [Alistipes indistinctus]
MDETYGIMVARGEPGGGNPGRKDSGTQRFLVNKCIESKIPVIIATQMLHTMISNPRPTRAEISDVANAIYQRVDAVMLSGETANGDYPVEAVETMARVAAEVEKDHSNPNIEMNLVRINNEITAQLCRSAVRATLNLPVKAIVIDTLSGAHRALPGRFPQPKARLRRFATAKASCATWLSLTASMRFTASRPSTTKASCSASSTTSRKKWLSKEDLIVVLGGSFGAAKGLVHGDRQCTEPGTQGIDQCKVACRNLLHQTRKKRDTTKDKG